ncbi:hypothetical protein PLUA15_180065 [Pseudomonas lundensis]|uniref:Uncharacterized protein n=1 Tax=Pseudomonas lundensis TaxID=86185 RepID=A0AAX2H4D8_9PSED|nr:hypothetical protein PLUA15_180065 [Pseudomonas lundensis]
MLKSMQAAVLLRLARDSASAGGRVISLNEYCRFAAHSLEWRP